MIKGSLLLSIPIIKRFLVEYFLSPKTRTFGSVFWTPWKNPWMDIRETYSYGQLLPSEVLRSAIFGDKVLSAVSKITRLILKKIKNTSNRAAVISGII